MSRARTALVAVAIAALAYGVATAFEPGLAGLLVVNEFYVPLLGGLAIVLGYRVAQRRRRTEIRGVETADPEIVAPVDAPGVSFDRRVAKATGYRRTTVETRQRVHDRLQDAAVAVVQRRFDCSRGAAIDRIEAGTWTDDPFAAAFLGGPDAPSPPLVARLRHALRTESSFQRDARRTADAIAVLSRRRPR